MLSPSDNRSDSIPFQGRAEWNPGASGRSCLVELGKADPRSQEEVGGRFGALRLFSEPDLIAAGFEPTNSGDVDDR
jgi:hypothetical protein